MRFELTVLGTSSQSPTLDRGQGGSVLRWGEELVLFDPGEGCQRQFLNANLHASRITRICITHFHGDHCLGLPGLIQSRALVTDRPLDLHYPAEGEHFVDRLLGGTVIDFDLRVVRRPLAPGDAIETSEFVLRAGALEHPTPTIGYRLEAPPSSHLVPARLDAAGIVKGRIKELQRDGQITHRGQTVTLEEMSERRTGPAMAYIMDTLICDGARELADGVDLLVCESTYLARDRELAHAHGHMTATEAGALAAGAGARLLVLSHFSKRYDDADEFATEARRHAPNVVAARDLSCISLIAPSRPGP